jgi:hypothetical protein
MAAVAAYLLHMRSLAAIAVLAATIGMTGCSEGSTQAGRDCFDTWNASSNQSQRSSVAGYYKVVSVATWRAQATGGPNVGGPASQGCGYLFHTSNRYLSISGVWRGKSIRWGVPPTISGSWSPEQQRAVSDNATVRGDGRLRRS